MALVVQIINFALDKNIYTPFLQLPDFIAFHNQVKSCGAITAYAGLEQGTSASLWCVIKWDMEKFLMTRGSRHFNACLCDLDARRQPLSWVAKYSHEGFKLYPLSIQAAAPFPLALSRVESQEQEDVKPDLTRLRFPPNYNLLDTGDPAAAILSGLTVDWYLLQ